MNKIIDLKLVPFCIVPLANYCFHFGLFHECETVYGILQTRILEWLPCIPSAWIIKMQVLNPSPTYIGGWVLYH